MGLEAFLTEQKFYSQTRNGQNFSGSLTDFTVALQGNVGDKVKAVSTIQLRWFSIASEFNTVQVIAPAAGSTLAQLNFNNGDFVTDGWTVGDSVNLAMINSTPQSVVFTGDVTFVSSGTMFVDVATGTATSGTYDTGSMVGSNALDSAILKYNLVENNANAQYTSVLNQEEQVYFASQIASGQQTMQVLTNGSAITWQNGIVKIENIGQNANAYQVFEIEHEFIILPYYLTNYSVFYNNGTIPPDLNGTNSLKYILNVDLRPGLGNVNSQKILESSDLLGNVGWFNENFNGFTNNFSVTSFTFSGTNNAIKSGGVTNCQVVINSATTFQAGQTFNIGFSRAVDEANFIPNTNFENTFLYDNAFCNVQSIIGDSTIIKNISTSTAGTNSLTIDFDVDLTPAQSAIINNGESYIVWISIGSFGITNQQDDRVSLLVDYAPFESTSDVPGLVEIEDKEPRNIKIYNHNNFLTDPTADTYDSFNGMVEDGYLCEFHLNSRADYGAIINKMSFNIVAYNNITNEEFVIYPFDIDLSSSINTAITGQTYTQQSINLNSTRGFNLEAGDQFNLANFETLSTAGGVTQYKAQIGFKINWEEWLANPNVNSIFYDNTKTNNNLNLNTSNYSVFENFNIYPRLDLNVSNSNFVDANGFNVDASSTNYSLYFPESIARNYGNDNTPKTNLTPIHQVDFTTTQLSTGNDTSGSLLTNEDCIIKARFTRVDGAVLGFTNYTGVIRIDTAQGGLFSIQELSTLANNDPLTINNLLKPIAGETRTKIEIDPAGYYVDLICQSNSANMTEGSSYTISSRLWSSDVEPPVVGDKKMENNTQKLKEDGTDKILE